MHVALGRPPLFLLDNWPIVRPLTVIADHEVAEQISQSSHSFKYSVPKAPTVERLVDVLGWNSLLLKQNEEWKGVRTRFNPGFAPNHLTTDLLPLLMTKIKIYTGILDQLAEAGKPFSLGYYTTNLTFDVIAAVAMDEDVHSQHVDPSQESGLICLFKEMLSSALFPPTLSV